MKYVQLGKTDLKVSRVCFGCWQLSPGFWGNIDLEDWKKALYSAVNVGVNFIDTADVYGDGYAESSLGDWFKESKNRDKFILATKFYWNFEQEARVPDTSYDYIIRECEASLKRLQTDHIDLYQIHGWDPLTKPEEVAAAFARLKKEGKVRWFGVSNVNADQLRMYLQYYDIECLQPPYNMLDREAEVREYPLCLEKKVGVITYSSLARGLMTGKYKPGHEFGDKRDNSPMYKGKKLERIQQGIESMRPFADKYSLTLPQLAVRWVLTHPAVTSAIVGVKKPEHIETIVAAADSILTGSDWHVMANIMSSAKADAKKISND